MTSLVSPGFKRPTFGLTQYRFGAVVLILKAITSFSVGLVTEIFEEETLKPILKLQQNILLHYNKSLTKLKFYKAGNSPSEGRIKNDFVVGHNFEQLLF